MQRCGAAVADQRVVTGRFSDLAHWFVTGMDESSRMPENGVRRSFPPWARLTNLFAGDKFRAAHKRTRQD
jgi:hypothetical protein